MGCNSSKNARAVAPQPIAAVMMQKPSREPIQQVLASISADRLAMGVETGHHLLVNTQAAPADLLSLSSVDAVKSQPSTNDSRAQSFDSPHTASYMRIDSERLLQSSNSTSMQSPQLPGSVQSNRAISPMSPMRQHSLGASTRKSRADLAEKPPKTSASASMTAKMSREESVSHASSTVILSNEPITNTHEADLPSKSRDELQEKQEQKANSPVTPSFTVVVSHEDEPITATPVLTVKNPVLDHIISEGRSLSSRSLNSTRSFKADIKMPTPSSSILKLNLHEKEVITIEEVPSLDDPLSDLRRSRSSQSLLRKSTHSLKPFEENIKMPSPSASMQKMTLSRPRLEDVEDEEAVEPDPKEEQEQQEEAVEKLRSNHLSASFHSLGGNKNSFDPDIKRPLASSSQLKLNVSRPNLDTVEELPSPEQEKTVQQVTQRIPLVTSEKNIGMSTALLVADHAIHEVMDQVKHENGVSVTATNNNPETSLSDPGLVQHLSGSEHVLSNATKPIQERHVLSQNDLNTNAATNIATVPVTTNGAAHWQTPPTSMENVDPATVTNATTQIQHLKNKLASIQRANGNTESTVTTSGNVMASRHSVKNANVQSSRTSLTTSRRASHHSSMNQISKVTATEARSRSSSQPMLS